MPKIELLHEDCMAVMARYPDNYFELAIVDPPYGIERFKKGAMRFDKSEKAKNGLAWDIKPTKKYWIELFRVSKNQIVWGANNFTLPESEAFIFWDKCQTVDNFAAGELAFVSMGIKQPAKIFKYAWGGLSDGVLGRNKKIKNIHPTQKPVKLYEWLLKNYAKEGDRILDTHGGSMSSAIAAHYGGFDMVLCELDGDYYEAGCKRFDNETSQIDMF
jgi:site-specific DNA-methyltransferase (adenine-specific)